MWKCHRLNSTRTARPLLIRFYLSKVQVRQRRSCDAFLINTLKVTTLVFERRTFAIFIFHLSLAYNLICNISNTAKKGKPVFLYWCISVSVAVFPDPCRRLLSGSAVRDGAGGGQRTHPQRHGLLLRLPLPLCHVRDPGQTRTNTTHQGSPPTWVNIITTGIYHSVMSLDRITSGVAQRIFITAWLEEGKWLDGLLDAVAIYYYRHWGQSLNK